MDNTEYIEKFKNINKATLACNRFYQANKDKIKEQSNQLTIYNVMKSINQSASR